MADRAPGRFRFLSALVLVLAAFTLTASSFAGTLTVLRLTRLEESAPAHAARLDLAAQIAAL